MKRFVMTGEQSQADQRPESDSSDADATQRFEQTVRQMLSTAPKPHDEMKMGAARKRDTRSSGKGAKGPTAK